MRFSWITLVRRSLDPVPQELDASHLGIAVKTLYRWKRQARSNNGYLIFDGRAVRFRHRQTAAAGQGRILFELQWLDELKSAWKAISQSNAESHDRRFPPSTWFLLLGKLASVH